MQAKVDIPMALYLVAYLPLSQREVNLLPYMLPVFPMRKLHSTLNQALLVLLQHQYEGIRKVT